LLALVAACAKKEGSGDAAGTAADDWVDPYMDDPQPPECQTSSGDVCTTDTGDGIHPTCDGTLDCADAEVCAAIFNGDIGTFVCQSCLADQDEARWCFDDAACCNPDATCVRGLCLPLLDGSSSGSSG
jgi:hypothetical protein